MHNHRSNWLGLISGSKQWLIAAPRDNLDALTFQHIDLQEATAMASIPASRVKMCHQRPGDVIFLPDQYWHSTYNLPVPRTVAHLAIGGMGPSSAAVTYASFGELASLKRLRKRAGIPALQRRTSRGVTALHAAAVPEVVDYLVSEGGINVSAPAPRYMGQRPSHAAAHRGDMATLMRLIALGARANETLAQPSPSPSSRRNDMTPMHLAANTAGRVHLEALVAAGARLDMRDSNGMQPLHYAAQSANVDGVVALLALGADPDSRTYDGRSVAQIALTYANDRGFSSLYNRLGVARVLEALANAGAVGARASMGAFLGRGDKVLQAAHAAYAAGNIDNAPGGGADTPDAAVTDDDHSPTGQGVSAHVEL